MMCIRDDRHEQSDPTPLTTANAEDLRLAAQSRVTVMVTAHSSRDREACARFIHAQGGRPELPFVRVDCGAGARSTRSAPYFAHHACLEDAADLHSRFEQARGGTLFIDNIGRMKAELQHQLFALLEQHVLRPADAGAQPVGSETRIIAATSRPLGGAIASGAFSESLFYRLNIVHIDLTDRRHMEGTVMRVREIMSTPAHECRPETDLAAVTQLMWDHDCGIIPIVDHSGGVAGVITDRDICISSAFRRQLPEQIVASQAMTAPVHACLPDDTLNDVLASMKRFRVRRLPVIDLDGRLQGVISLNDVVLTADQRASPSAGDIMSTMAAICAHRPDAAPSSDLLAEIQERKRDGDLGGLMSNEVPAHSDLTESIRGL